MNFFKLLALTLSILLVGCGSTEQTANTEKAEAYSAMAVYVNYQATHSEYANIFTAALNKCGGMASVEAMESTSCLMAISTLEARDSSLRKGGSHHKMYLAFAKHI